jgi:hypothetical protein
VHIDVELGIADHLAVGVLQQLDHPSPWPRTFVCSSRSRGILTSRNRSLSGGVSGAQAFVSGASAKAASRCRASAPHRQPTAGARHFPRERRGAAIDDQLQSAELSTIAKIPLA